MRNLTKMGLAVAFTLGTLAGVQAAPKFDISISRSGIKLISSKNPNLDTFSVDSYVYNGGDGWKNTGTTPLLYQQLMIGSTVLAKHYIKAGDSLESLSGFTVTDTVTAPRPAFALSSWSDPLTSFGKEPAVEGLRLVAFDLNFHHQVVTLVCPPSSIAPFPVVVSPLLAAAVPSTIFNVMGKPIWNGKLHTGELPEGILAEGVYILVQGSQHHSFRIGAR